ncbi:hypothetical protein FRC96_20130 [Lujinxingia vulgaris]|uniref:Uncharacterized protein n=1 Tax=Lujinxingia vulgaris TaxID=2600176 RepID=A0A5C6WTH8_9DELT|nr:hypothetical protein [Lujinxingia vulgaris]TXD31783.1 hypothetical protein FRC96_20130 [Lujinxingia vulgaris]
MIRFFLYAALAATLLATSACKKSEPEEPLRVDESEYEEDNTIESSVSTPLSRRQMEYQEQALETITEENAVEVLTELEQEIQRDVDQLQVQFDELGLELPED